MAPKYEKPEITEAVPTCPQCHSTTFTKDWRCSGGCGTQWHREDLDGERYDFLVREMGRVQ